MVWNLLKFGKKFQVRPNVMAKIIHERLLYTQLGKMCSTGETRVFINVITQADLSSLYRNISRRLQIFEKTISTVSYVMNGYSYFLTWRTYLLACLLTFLLTYLLAYLLAYLLSYLLTCLLACLLAYLLTYLLTCFLPCLLTYFLTYLLTHSLTYLLTHLLTYLLTYLLTHSFHWVESYLRS
jgi:hypothetical protein